MNENESPPRALSALRRAGRAVGAVELTIGMVSLLAILVLVFLQAAQRYLPVPQVAWTGEISRFGLVWLTFSAAGLLVTSRGHIALELVDSIPNERVVRAVQAFALVVLTVIGFGLTLEAWALVQTQGVIRSPVLRLPMSLVYLPVLLGLVSTTVRAAITAVEVIVHGPVIADPAEDGPVDQESAS